MTEPPKEGEDGPRPILRFYINMQYDARTYVNYRYAPSDWSEKSAEEKEAFLRNEADQWMDELITWGAEVHDHTKVSGPLEGWEQGGWVGEPEDYYD